MLENTKIATRESYGNALKELGGRVNDLIVLDADLAGATRTCMFRDRFPDRFLDCGIAEANMMGVAAGLSAMGLVPFASSFAMFAAGRAYEQIRNSIGYPHLNVKIAATHGGVSVGEDGATHQCFEDFALMRAIPEMVVLCPSDDIEAKQMVEAAYNYKGPVYMRFGRAYSPVFHTVDYKFEIGKGEILLDGTDVAVIANGLMVAEALYAAEELKKKDIHMLVINMPSIKPMDEELIVKAAKKCGRMLTAEEHSVIGGLGEAVSSVLGERYPIPMKRIGINDTYGHSGPCNGLLAEYGLSMENIIKETLNLMGSD